MTYFCPATGEDIWRCQCNTCVAWRVTGRTPPPILKVKREPVSLTKHQPSPRELHRQEVAGHLTTCPECGYSGDRHSRSCSHRKAS